MLWRYAAKRNTARDKGVGETILQDSKIAYRPWAIPEGQGAGRAAGQLAFAVKRLCQALNTIDAAGAKKCLPQAVVFSRRALFVRPYFKNRGWPLSGYSLFYPSRSVITVVRPFPRRTGFFVSTSASRCAQGPPMHKEKKEAIQVTKEIMVKFIEMGKVSPTSFSQVFPAVYQVVLQTLDPIGEHRHAEPEERAE